MKLPVFRFPKLVLLSICVSVLFVCLCYVASQWYYSRWDVPDSVFTSLGYRNETGGLFSIEEVREALSQDSYIGADDPSSRSPELVANIEAFEAWLFKHPFVQYDEYSPKVLERQFKAARGDKKTELGWKIIDQFDHAHDFMIDLMNLYADQRLPFTRESEEYQFIKEMIDGYCHLLDTVPDPFGTKAFAELQQQIEADEKARAADPEWQRIQREADSARQTLAELEKMLQAYDQSRGIKGGQQTSPQPWTMPSPDDGPLSTDFDPEEVFSQDPDKTFDLGEDLSSIVEDKGRKDNDDTMEIDTYLDTPLSPERFNQTQQLMDQYGAEEGLRQFREMDPDAARQFEAGAPSAREVPSEVESSTQ